MNSRLIKYIQTSHILATVAAEGSFSKAAKVLGVHQTAISHRVKSLEDALGLQIFKRSTRMLTPTTLGETLCQAATAAVTDLKKTYHQVTTQQQDKAIRLTTVSSLAMKWFLPLMPDAKLKGIEISLHVLDDLVDILAGEADVGIRFGTGNYPDLHKSLLHTVSMQPVVSPAYLKKHNLDPSALGGQNFDVLVDKLTDKEALGFRWMDYINAIDNNGPHQRRPVSYIDRTDLTLHAAINGLGVALGRSFIVEEDIENGFLVPFDKPIQIKSSYWLVCSPDYARTQKFKKLENWLKETIHNHNYL
jgi:LysR family glycine cleavage system transcriptional activator